MMTRPALLAAVLLACGPAAAQTSSGYGTADAAAIAFVQLVRGSYPAAATKEYCAWIVKGPDGRFRFGAINEGDFNGCYMPDRPAQVEAAIHTHPTRAGENNLEAAGQFFSEEDLAGAEGRGRSPQPRASYLGAPAGHVLRYDPGGSECRGTSFIRRNFRLVHGISAADAEKLPVKPGKWMPLYDAGGKPLAKPDYCKPPSS